MLRFFLLMLFALPAFAADVAGVQFEERVRVGPAELVLNGAGLRKRAFFQVYAIGLYLAGKTSAPDEAVRAPGPKRVAIHMLRDVDAEQFSAALVEGIRANHSDAAVKNLEPRVKELSEAMLGLKEARKGMAILLQWTGTETQLLVDGKPAGRAIAGEDFYQALLRIWLGDHPVQEDLKKVLTGQAR
jgi:hypothetical protein